MVLFETWKSTQGCLAWLTLVLCNMPSLFSACACLADFALASCLPALVSGLRDLGWEVPSFKSQGSVNTRPASNRTTTNYVVIHQQLFHQLNPEVPVRDHLPYGSTSR